MRLTPGGARAAALAFIAGWFALAACGDDDDGRPAQPSADGGAGDGGGGGAAGSAGSAGASGSGDEGGVGGAGGVGTGGSGAFGTGGSGAFGTGGGTIVGDSGTNDFSDFFDSMCDPGSVPDPNDPDQCIAGSAATDECIAVTRINSPSTPVDDLSCGAGCACNNGCATEFYYCMEDADCRLGLLCVERTGCVGVLGCYADDVCKEVIDSLNGGPVGLGSRLLTALDSCTADNGCGYSCAFYSTSDGGTDAGAEGGAAADSGAAGSTADASDAATD